MKSLLLLPIFLLFINVSAQKRMTNAVKITYLKSSNGTLLENQDPILIFADQDQTIVTSQKTISKSAIIPIERSYIDRKNGYFLQHAQLSGKAVVTVDSTSIAKQVFELMPETKMILGYKCSKAKTIINSNTIELWYTNDLKIKAAPTSLGQNLGLVLEVTRNGNYTIAAQKIEKLKAIPAGLWNVKGAIPVDLLTYRDVLWKSRFVQLDVFRQEIINFSEASKSNDSILRFAKGTIIVRKMVLPKIAKGSQVFLDVTEQSNGDAYDRTGSVFLIPTDKEISFFAGLNANAKQLPVYDNGNGKQYQGVVITDNYLPLIELMRFFTPFGIKQYNTIQLKNKTWQDSVYYRQDISEFIPMMSGKAIWVGINIGNYDNGGHKVSAAITIHPKDGSVKMPGNFILPLFNTNNIMEMAGQEYATMFNVDKGLEVSFTLETDVKNAILRYITTGHGGWENGDEFLQKTNTIVLDGKEKYQFIPWRMDCGSYRSYNPASGNFNNGLSSSDYSRSNWCPGTVTNPEFIALGDLKAGKHTIQVKIPQGAPEGGSFSSWNVSGVLIGIKE